MRSLVPVTVRTLTEAEKRAVLARADGITEELSELLTPLIEGTPLDRCSVVSALANTSVWALDRVFQGAFDQPINATGRSPLEDFIEGLHHYAKVYRERRGG